MDIIDLKNRLQAEGSELSKEAAQAIDKLGELLENVASDVRNVSDLIGRYAAHVQERGGKAYLTPEDVGDDPEFFLTPADAEIILELGEKFGVTTSPTPGL